MGTTRRGRPDVFTPKQNISLRAALKRLRAERSLSQERIGALLGVSQQTASKLLDGAGFAYATATALAQVLGHPTVDAFFASKTAASSSTDVTVNLARSA